MIEHKSIIDTAACIVDTESDSKQLTMSGWAVEALQSGQIRKLSKGVIAYECLHFAYSDYSDRFTKIEQNVSEQVTEDVFGLVDGMVKDRQNQAEEKLSDVSEYPPEETVDNVRVHMPEEFLDELPSYRAGHHIADAVSYVYASPWSSRHDRLQDVQDIVALIQGQDVDNPSMFVHSVIAGESVRFDVADLHAAIPKSEDDEWYLSDSVTKSDLIQSGTEIPQGSKRVRAIETALINSEKDYYTKDSVTTNLGSWFDDVRPATREKYLNDVNFDRVNDVDMVDIDISSIVYEIKTETLENAPVKSMTKIDRQEDWKVAGFKEDPSDFDGTYPPSEAADVLDDIESKLLTSSATPIKDKNIDKVGSWIDSKRDEIQSG